MSQEERATKADEHKNKGNTLLNENKFKEAIEEYTIAVRCLPSNADSTKQAIYYSNRGLAYQRLEDHDNAIKDLQSALKHDPKYIKAYHRLGHSFYAKNDLSSATKVIQEGLVVEPNNQPLLKLQTQIKEPRSGRGAVDDEMVQGFPGAGGGFPGMPGGFPGMPGGFPGMGGPGMGNIMEMMNNPEFMNMATQLVNNNPEIMQMVSQITQNPQMMQQVMGQFQNAGLGIPGGPVAPPDDSVGMSGLNDE